jgi:nucleotide-binding universal stress UspA family protein
MTIRSEQVGRGGDVRESSRPPVNEEGRTGDGPVVVGYDSREPAERALDRGMAEASARAVDVVVLVVAPVSYESADPFNSGLLYVAPVMPIPPEGPPAVQPALAEARKRLRETGAVGSVEWSLGDPAGELLRLATERHASAIVVGAHHHSALDRLLGGDTAANVMRDAGCDVIVAD